MVPQTLRRRRALLTATTVGLGIVSTSIWLSTRGAVYDYHVDAGPPISALIAGDLRGALDQQPLMGPLSLLLRAPFALAAKALGLGESGQYHFGIFPCAVLWTTVVAGMCAPLVRQRETILAAAILLWICIFGPFVEWSLFWGHPEDLMTAALAVLAVYLASRGKPVLAGVAFGAALATKQWALVAFVPVAVALAPSARPRFALATAAVVAVAVAPLLIGNGAEFVNTHREASSVVGGIVSPTSLWWPFHTTVVTHVFDGVTSVPHYAYFAPEAISRLSRPLIVLIPLAILALVWRRPFDLAQALALLALVLVLRAVLDPVTIDYYNVPLLLGVAAWESQARRGLPVVTMLTATALWLTYRRVFSQGNHTVTWLAYMAWTLPLMAYLGRAAFARRRPGRGGGPAPA